ncbi:hypothetical protein [Pseudomonas huanghezhanensis]|uniref:hypothetical protein n=1 Tax=Pseudomonas huanghezhanensis TaxID=3002903 RepID=UPI002285EFC2|nr:hypothetical protein [Pseudomonas sp. BSw22131]
MPSNKRGQVRTGRRLVAALTEACETAKAEIIGFEWLTHEVDYGAFRQSLRVIWVFDTRLHKEHALAGGQDARMRELTARALADAEVDVSRLDRCVQFDSEEECSAQHGGDWRSRVAGLYAVKGHCS